MNTSTLASMAQYHRCEAIWFLLKTRGLALGHKQQTLKHVGTWYQTKSLELVPKIWHDKVEAIFNECISSDQMRALDQALDLYVQGDDSELRPFIKGRVSVEFGSRTDNSRYGGAPGWRSRKFSDPLYLTPAGFLQAYPEADEDLFLDMEQARAALEFYKSVPNKLKLDHASYRISSPAVLGSIGGAGFKRWLKEVKNQDYTEPRRSLAEAHSIYSERGRAGLKDIYSPAYVYVLLRKFKASGLAMVAEDLARIVR